MSIHVVHLVSSFDTGGLQNGIVNLINHGEVARLRHTVLSMSPATGMKDRLKRGEVRALALDGGRKLLSYRVVARALRDLAPDVVHSRNRGTHVDGILGALRAGVKARVHGYHGRDLANAGGESLRRRWLGRYLCRKTDRVVTLTAAMKKEFIRDYGCAEDKITVIANGIDLDRLDRFERVDDLAGRFTVATVGRLDAVKNLPLLIESFLAMKNRHADDRLLIAGDGPERKRLESILAEKSSEQARSVHLLGARDDAPAVMKSADVYVQPSFYEGMSNTIVEAMACGVAVVATRVGGNADVCGDDGDARLVPSDDVDAMTRALEELRDDRGERERMARAGRERVQKRFTLDKMVEAYTRMYEDLVFEKKGGTACH